MSASRFSEFPTRYDPDPVCFYCGKDFEEIDVHVEWHGNGKRPGGVSIDLHENCARDLAVHLAADHLRANLRRCNGT